MSIGVSIGSGAICGGTVGMAVAVCGSAVGLVLLSNGGSNAGFTSVRGHQVVGHVFDEDTLALLKQMSKTIRATT